MKVAGLPTTRWRMPVLRQEAEERLARELGLHPLVSRILASREILDPRQARRFLSPSLNDLYSPFLLQDMRKAIDRTVRALHRGEKILVYGDYDADGVTSVAVLVKFLRILDPSAEYYIPDRMDEGYGLHRAVVDEMRGRGVDLLLTVDCGISDHEAIRHARSLGMDVIVLDHHEAPETLPPAFAAINPHRRDCRFPFKHLAAVGIAFNFLIALRGVLRSEGYWRDAPYPNLREYLDLVAIGTIGDIVPLVDENRIFTRIGLELITEGRRPGIQALREIGGIDTMAVDSVRASFSIVPRINAAGRIASPADAVELLLTDDPDAARVIARRLDGHNRRRQAMERAILEEIDAEIARRGALDAGALIFASDRWHPGVIGVVASRLVDRYRRPAILISLRDGVGKGSGRSLGTFNIFQALRQCDRFLLSYGGHRYAAGISIREEDIAAFSATLAEFVREQGRDAAFESQTLIDLQCALRDVSHELVDQMGQLAPFGSQNPEPVLCVENVNVTSSQLVGNNHLRLRVNGDGVSCNSIWFRKGHLAETLAGNHLDIAFTPQINHWKGVSNIQLKVCDIALRPPA